MNIDLLLSLITAAPTLIGDVDAAVAKLKSDPTVAAKVTDGVTALQHLVIDLQGVIAKL
jgi:hypothetical protein